MEVVSGRGRGRRDARAIVRQDCKIKEIPRFVRKRKVKEISKNAGLSGSWRILFCIKSKDSSSKL